MVYPLTLIINDIINQNNNIYTTFTDFINHNKNIYEQHEPEACIDRTDRLYKILNSVV